MIIFVFLSSLLTTSYLPLKDKPDFVLMRQAHGSEWLQASVQMTVLPPPKGVGGGPFSQVGLRKNGEGFTCM